MFKKATFDQTESSSTVDNSSTFPLSNPALPTVDYSGMATQPFLLTNYAWTSASGSAVYNFPASVVVASPTSFYNNMVNMYSYSHTSWKFHIKVNGTMFHVGKLLIGWLPGGSETSYPNALDEYLTRPHIIIDASSSGVFDFIPPKVFHKRGIRTKNPLGSSEQGILFIIPYSPLAYSTGASTTLDVNVWAVPEEVTTYAPCPLPGLVAVAQGLGKVVTNAGYGLVDTLVSAGKGLIGSIPLVGGLLSSFLDRPPHTQETIVVRKYASPSAWGEGESASTTLTLTPGLKYLRDPKLTGDPCTMRDFMALEHRVGGASISVTAGSGALVAQLPLYPNAGNTDIYGTVNADVTYSPRGVVACKACSLGYLSACYKKWRGSLRVVFEFICASMVTQTYAVVWDPDRVSFPTTLNYSAISGTASTFLIEVRGSTKQTVTIPYASEVPFRNTVHLSYNNLDAGTNDPGLESINGVLGLFAITAPNAPSNAPASVSVNVYLQPGDDFEFAVPTGQELNNIIQYGDYGIYTRAAYDPKDKAPPGAFPQSAPNPLPVTEDHEDVFDPSKELAIAPEIIMPVTTTLQAKELFGEDSMDIYKLMKRYQPFITTEMGASTDNGWVQMILPVTPNIHPMYFYSSAASTKPIAVGLSSSNFINHFSGMARYWAGSLNYRVMYNTGIEEIRASFFPSDSSFGSDNFQNFTSINVLAHSTSDFTPANAVDYSWKRRSVMMRGAMGMTGMDVGHGQTGTCMEFTVPYVSNQDMMLSDPTYGAMSGTSNWSSNASPSYNGHTVTGVLCIWARISGETNTAVSPKISVDIAAGDDFVLYQAVQIPQYQMINLR